MAEVQSTLRTGPFGTEFVPVPDTQLPGDGTVAGVPQPDGPRVPLTDEAVAGDLGFAQARGRREQRANRVEANFIESAGAAMYEWDTSRLVRRLARPGFEGDAPINQFEYLEQIPMVLDKDERDYFMDVGKGQKSAEYAIDQIRTRRQARQAIGDHEIVGLSSSMLDPMWLAVPPAIRIGKTAPTAGRAISAVTSAGIAGTVSAIGEGPVSDEEIALSMLMNGAAGGALYKGGKVVPHDPDFPQAALNKSVAGVEGVVKGNPKPHYKMSTDGTMQEVPRPLQPGGAVESTAAELSSAVEAALTEESKARGLGEKMMWNMHKTMSGYGEAGKKIANLLYDNNSDLSLTSTESVREALLGELRTHQIRYEDMLRAQMGVEGHGTAQMVNPATSRQAYEAQLSIERTVQEELFRREQFSRQGRDISGANVPKHISDMADELDKMHKRALAELKAAGVEGADTLLERPGYLNRRWSSQHIDTKLDEMKAMGLTHEQALGKLYGLVGLAVRRGSNMEKKLADQVGQAIVDRALRKGYFEDTVFNAPAGEGQLKELRDILKNGGMTPQEVERALNVIRVQTDDAGKAGFLKHRMDLDYKAAIRVGAQEIKVGDLIDGRVTSIVDQYNQRVATQVAFAQKGLKKPSDIEALREELLKSIKDEGERAQAKQLFDNTIANFRGEPSGQPLNENFRLAQAFTRMISLTWSGLWQATEYANPMAEYGMLKTLKYGMQEIPGFRGIMKPSTEEAGQLNTVLADHSVQSLRLRPYLARFEDGYEMDMGSAMQLSAQTAGQLVPYANAMRYVHHHQAKIVGNLILDRLDMAAKGNTKAREALAKFGIDQHVMDEVAGQIKQHGFKVDEWDDAVWMQTRPAFAKMMDAAVLRGRLGDTPAFAAFDPVGKFIFTYRSFVLVAHNKLLAGGLERNGLSGVGLLMMYQFPLALAAVQAQSVLKGQGVLDERELVKKGIGQMGGIGLFSEPFKWAAGESNSIGAPGLIAVDRGVKMFQGLAQGDLNKAGTSAMTLLPVANANPIFNAMVQQMKEQ